MAQTTLLDLGLGSRLNTVVISRRRDFEKLFEGFTRLRAISYVSSAELVLEFLDQWGFEEIELLVGDNIDAKQLKDDLVGKSPGALPSGWPRRWRLAGSACSSPRKRFTPSSTSCPAMTQFGRSSRAQTSPRAPVGRVRNATTLSTLTRRQMPL